MIRSEDKPIEPVIVRIPLDKGFRLWFTLSIQPDKAVYPKRIQAGALKFYGGRKISLPLISVESDTLEGLQKAIFDAVAKYMGNARRDYFRLINGFPSEGQ